MNKLHICIICEQYPSKQQPVFTFVDQLVRQMADQDVKCTVVSPQSITQSLTKQYQLVPTYEVRYTQKGNTFEVYRPYVITASTLKINRTNVSMYLMRIAVEICLSKHKLKPDVFYCHFWHSSYFVLKYAKKHRIPVFVASGESQINIGNYYKRKVINDIASYISGVICVSNKNKQESISLGLTTEKYTTIIPNAIDSSIFYPIDKSKIREDLHFRNSDFIIVFVGSFINRKGCDRVAKAITQLNNEHIKSIFIGKGPITPQCDGILYCGPLPHNEIVKYLNCADVFVLPTLHEGCCNAILEAMACALPIISANKSFNDDILTDEYAIKIDPENIAEIANAINYLYNNQSICKEMGNKAYRASKSFNIEKRSERIITFIRQCLNNVSES